MNRARERSIGRRCKEKGVMNNEIRNIKTKTIREEEQDIQDLQETIRRNQISTALCAEIIAAKQQKIQNQRFYNSKEWRRVRDLAVERDGCIDVWEYLTTGRIVYPKRVDVHHIAELDEAPELRCSMSNLITVSQENHRLIDQLYHRGDKEKIQEILRDEVRRRNTAFFGNAEGTGQPIVGERQLSIFDMDVEICSGMSVDDEDDNIFEVQTA